MKRNLSLIFCYALLFLLVSCKTADINPYKITKPYLFEANKGSKTIYVFGTVHYGIYSDDLPTWFWPVFNSADVYAYESPPDKKTGNKLQLWFKSKFLKNPKAKTLKQLLTAQEFKNLDIYFPDLKNKEKYFSDKSAFFALHVSQMKLFQKEFEPSVSNVERDKNGTDRKHWTNRTLDDDLAIKSKELKKENFRLDEDTEEDFKCIYQTDEKEVLQALKYRLKDSSELVNPTKENTFEDELLKSYILGDMSRPKASDSRASALNIGCYNSGRNLLWIPRIKRILETYDKVFVVVGASHVIKETPTLLNLLEKNGFSIKRVTK